MISVLNVREVDRDIELIGSTPDILLYCGRSSSFTKAHQLVPELVDCSFFGNPHPINYEGARDRVCESFKTNVLWPAMKNTNGNRIKKAILRLAERDRSGDHIGLCCFCKPKRCHCDEIIKAVAWVNHKAEIQAHLETEIALEPVRVEKPAPVTAESIDAQYLTNDVMASEAPLVKAIQDEFDRNVLSRVPPVRKACTGCTRDSLCPECLARVDAANQSDNVYCDPFCSHCHNRIAISCIYCSDCVHGTEFHPPCNCEHCVAYDK